jgi:hypothetical protein
MALASFIRPRLLLYEGDDDKGSWKRLFTSTDCRNSKSVTQRNVTLRGLTAAELVEGQASVTVWIQAFPC